MCVASKSVRAINRSMPDPTPTSTSGWATRPVHTTRETRWTTSGLVGDGGSRDVDRRHRLGARRWRVEGRRAGMKASTVTPTDLFGLPCQYVVPLFQRPYVWNRVDQWEPLWDDV